MIIAILVLVILLAILQLSTAVVLKENNDKIEAMKADLETLEEIELEALPQLDDRCKAIEENMMLVAKNVSDLTEVLLSEPEQYEDAPNTKPDFVRTGGVFETIIDCKILGVFFFKDKKFAVITPFMNSKYVPIPSVVGITQEGTIDFNLGGEGEDEEVKGKALNVYNDFKEKNRDSFLEDQ